MDAQENKGFGWGAMIGMFVGGLAVGGGVAFGVMVLMEEPKPEAHKDDKKLPASK